mmetsp:Transcript_56529/g.93422  ORF Transcript_56529/g.93422 Transcript_56529/m.93422 type:complete len:91 (+) Transcript_56529:88-360(+)
MTSEPMSVDCTHVKRNAFKVGCLTTQSCLAASHVVVQDHLRVFVCLELDSSGIVAWSSLRVDVNDFSIPFVFEEKSGFIISNHLEIWCRI